MNSKEKIMENKGTRLITIIIVAVAVIVSIVLIVILDGAERSAIAAATNDNSILNPVIGSTEPTYEHDDFLKCSGILKKDENKVICYIQNTSSNNCSANYTISFKNENNHEIGHTTGTIPEILAGDYRFSIVEKDIPADTAKVEVFAKSGTMSANPFKLQMQTEILNEKVKITIPAYNAPITLKEIQVCFMDANNGIVNVQIIPASGVLPANTPYSFELPSGTAKQVAAGAYGYIQ
jgi:hypothetical protein